TRRATNATHIAATMREISTKTAEETRKSLIVRTPTTSRRKIAEVASQVWKEVPARTRPRREMCSGFLSGLAPQAGLEPTTLRLTAGCSAIELLRSSRGRERIEDAGGGVNEGGPSLPRLPRRPRDLPGLAVGGEAQVEVVLRGAGDQAVEASDLQGLSGE